MLPTATHSMSGLEVPRSKWKTPPKVIADNRAKIPWDFQIQTDKMVVANLPDIMVVDKQDKKVVVQSQVLVISCGE